MPDPDQHAAHPSLLAVHYRHFRVADRLLLTGHSHQAWPDVALSAQMQAWHDAAAHVDEKWELAFAQAERVRQGYALRLDDPDGDYALAASTHDLVIRFLSALPLRERPVLLTTDGEFHTLRRQLDRLGEAGVTVRKVAAEPTADLAARLAAAVDDRVAAVLVSCVLFRTGRIVRDLGQVEAACQRHGAELLVDAYHAVNVVPFSLPTEGLTRAFVTGGGYKYCQLGEGNAFLRIPPGCKLRPVITGWFAEFADLAAAPHDDRVAYGDGAVRFAGATYDPVSHYRAAAVWDFFADKKLTPASLRAISQQQIARLAAGFDGLDLDPALVTRDRTTPLAEIGGFLVLQSPHAGTLCRALRERGVWTDHRDQALRFGPAPYLSDRQLDIAMALLGEVARATREQGGWT
jgi:kynureninase